jgi:hypothetical protein
MSYMSRKLTTLLFLLLTIATYSQNYEVYTGVVKNERSEMQAGYVLGANFIIKTNQNREYLNNLLFGFEHSAFMSDEYVVASGQTSVQTSTCDACDTDSIRFDETNASKFKDMVRGVTLNLGVEISKRWYVVSGITNYQHIRLMNGNKITEYRTNQINAGVKYFIKSKHWFFSPTITFNPEVITASVGISYN